MKFNDKIRVPFSCRVMGVINFMNWWCCYLKLHCCCCCCCCCWVVFM